MENLYKEFYDLSKLRYLIKKELDNLNKNLINFDFKKKLIIEKNNIINNLKEFNENDSVQIFKTIPINGIEKTIGIIKNTKNSKHNFLKDVSSEIENNTEYIAIDIQRRYTMKNEKYFELHFEPIYQEIVKDPNEKLTNLQSRPDIFDFKIDKNEITYKLFSINPSRKQNLSLNFRERMIILMNELSYDSDSDKNIILNKYLKSIDNRLEFLKNSLIQNFDFKENIYCDMSVTEKKDKLEVSIYETSENLITKVLNGHAIIKNAIQNNIPILEDMYEEKIDFKILEIGSKDDVLNKISKVIEIINNNALENSQMIEEIVENEINNKFTDPFEGL